MNAAFRILIRGLRHLLGVLLALVLLFEEWGWSPLARAVARMGQWPIWGSAWSSFEAAVRRLNRWGALAVFALPMLALLPIKLIALKLIATGHAVAGVVSLLGAKLVGTAFVARLFQLTEPALMQFSWFARWFPRWRNWKDALLARTRAWLDRWLPWRWSRRAAARLARRWHTWRAQRGA